MRTAVAYYNHGRWVCDCPEPGCTDARLVYHPETGVRQTEEVCADGHHFRIEMPPPDVEAQVVAVLAERPVTADRGWYPKTHTRALLAGQRTGQTVEQLRAENHEVATYRAAKRDAEQQQLREILGRVGIEVRPDGTFEGSL